MPVEVEKDARCKKKMKSMHYILPLPPMTMYQKLGQTNIKIYIKHSTRK